MNLHLRKIVHPQARNNYRVILKDDSEETEVGSIGVQHQTGTTKQVWHWGIDNVIPMRDTETEGSGEDRHDCMRKFRAAWNRFSADEARLTEFLREKRKRVG